MRVFDFLESQQKRKLINLGLVLLNLCLLGALYWVFWANNPKTDSLAMDSPELIAARERLKVSLMEGRNHSNAAAAYAYPTGEIRSYIDGTVPTDQKLVFLTFDDGIDQNMTPQILDILKEHQVPATFFLIGNNLTAESLPLMERQITEGHAIALHSMSHNMHYLYPNHVGNTQRIMEEMAENRNLLRRLMGDKFQANVWRYPGGHMSWTGLEEADAQLATQGVQWIDWNASNGDAEPEQRRPKTLEAMLDFHLHSSEPFPASTVKVVLMHDLSGKDLTPQALPTIIQHYKDQGYNFGVLY